MDESETGHEALRQAVSALADGEASAAELDAVLEAWAIDPALRDQWQAHHLVGDALRSEDLLMAAGASQAGQAALLHGLRHRLRQEPRALAPAAAARAAAKAEPAALGRWRWLSPAAVAAGFVCMSAVLVLERQGDETSAPAPNWAQHQAQPGSGTHTTHVSAGQGPGIAVGLPVGLPAQAFSSGVPVRGDLPPVLWPSEGLPGQAVAAASGSVPASMPPPRTPRP